MIDIVDLMIIMVENGYEDLWLAVRMHNVFALIAEIVVVSIYPWIFQLRGVQLVVNVAVNNTILVPEELDLETVLTIVMFARLYLLFRTLTLHHKIRDSLGPQILGPLNRVSLDFSFAFKAIMQDYAWTMITVQIITVIVIASWAMRLCEASYGQDRGHPLNTAWVVIITYFTIGYLFRLLEF